MDADLQDDPSEIPKFLAKISEGFDVVSGWKNNRQDPISKTLPSKLFNKITAKITGIPLHDFNCGFKAYKKEVLKGIKIYGELHRYIPVLAHELGFISTEVSVNHNKREFGESKYGWERYTRGLVDLLTVLATTRYLTKPGHLFGGLGVLSGLLGTLILSYLGVLWFVDDAPIGTRPLFSVGILLEILSIQMISLGVLAELITRHSDSGPSQSAIEDKRGFK
jgi:glycosyltransferase involved in cell wall biosynthesis